MLAIGGWGDAYKNAVPQIVANIPGAKGIVGPWVHKYPHFAVPEPRIGFLQEALRWWDRWLKDLDTGVEDDPDYRPYLMDGVRPAAWYTERPGRWLADPQAEAQRWFLSAAGLADTPGPLHHTVASPQTTGADAGEYCAIWLGPELPGDHRRDDALSATFDSAPLKQDMPITGAPVVTLDLSADYPLAQIAVRLNHIHPDGAATRITYGVLNLATALGRPLVPGQRETVTLSLDHVAYAVPAGHHLRLSISTAYWPLIWPSPDPVTLTLHSGSLVADKVTDADGWTFPPPDAADPWQTEELRAENHIRRQETDMTTGIVTLVIEDDFGKVRDLDHGLINGSIARERWSIHPDDPLSARGECHWTDEIERDDIRLRTETRCAMWSDATQFYLHATVEAFEGDVPVFERTIEDTIPRDEI